LTYSSILLKCGHCTNKIGSLNINDISLRRPEQVVTFLVNNRISILCGRCACSHEFSDHNDDNLINLLDTGQRNTSASEREEY
jgi:hypothetical protein